MSNFLYDQRGAVTVDWVVMTAAVVGLGMAAMAVTSGGVENLSNDTARELALLEVGQSPFSTLPGFDLSGFTHAIDDGLAESQFAEYASDDYSDEEVETELSTYHDRLAGGSASYSDVDVDRYAGTYAAAVERGMDVSDYTDPSEFSTIYHAANS